MSEMTSPPDFREQEIGSSGLVVPGNPERPLNISEPRTLEDVPPPDGFIVTDSGLVAPKPPSTNESPEDPPKHLILPDASDVRRVTGTVEAEPTYDAAYLWLDPLAGLNRSVAHASLDHLRATFGDLHRYTENDPESRDAVLEAVRSIRAPEETQALLAEFHKLTETLSETLPDKAIDDATLWSSLTLIADTISINQDMADIPQTEGLHQLCLRALSHEAPSTQVLDFISRCEITNELADALLDRIDIHPSHPLYWIVADKRPAHPRVQRQREMVLRLQDKDSFRPTMDDIYEFGKLVPLGSLMSRQWPRSGLEIETTVFGGPAKVPDGAVMGTDVARHGNILELRLDHGGHPEVLTYDAAWRRRYFEIWRWGRVSRSVNTSIHLHSEGVLKIGNAQVMFGSDTDDCRINNHGTIEVRTALEGYKGGQGYPELPSPILLELLHSLDMSDPVLPRIAEMYLKTGVYGSRLSRSTNELVTARDGLAYLLERGSEHELETLAYNLAAIPAEHQAEVITAILERGNSYGLETLAHNLAAIPVEHQAEVITAILERGNSYGLETLAHNLAAIPAEHQTRVITTILERGNSRGLEALARNLATVPAEHQAEVITAILEGDNSRGLETLANNLAAIPAEHQTRVITTILERGNSRGLEALARNLATVPAEHQAEVITAILKRGSDSGLEALARNLPAIPAEHQTRVITTLLERDNSRGLEALARNLATVPAEHQARVAAAVSERGCIVPELYNSSRRSLTIGASSKNGVA